MEIKDFVVEITTDIDAGAGGGGSGAVGGAGATNHVETGGNGTASVYAYGPTNL